MIKLKQCKEMITKTYNNMWLRGMKGLLLGTRHFEGLPTWPAIVIELVGQLLIKTLDLLN